MAAFRKPLKGDTLRKECRPLTDSEIADAQESFSRTRDKARFKLGLKIGLRISELLGLKISDVYQYGRMADSVYVERKHLKTKVEGRDLPLHPEAQRRLERVSKGFGKNWESRPKQSLIQVTPGKSIHFEGNLCYPASHKMIWIKKEEPLRD